MRTKGRRSVFRFSPIRCFTDLSNLKCSQFPVDFVTKILNTMRDQSWWGVVIGHTSTALRLWWGRCTEIRRTAESVALRTKCWNLLSSTLIVLILQASVIILLHQVKCLNVRDVRSYSRLHCQVRIFRREFNSNKHQQEISIIKR